MAKENKLVMDFLGDAFGEVARGKIWVASFEVDNSRCWFGGTLSDIKSFGDEKSNNYFCTSLLCDDARSRSNHAVEAHVMLFADDVGSKVPEQAWIDFLEKYDLTPPNWKLETSPGNGSWYWWIDHKIYLADANGNAIEAERLRALRLLRAKFVALGLSDAVQDDVRYMRAPFGVNSKDVYLKKYGAAVPVTGIKSDAPRIDVLEWADKIFGRDWRAKSDNDLGLILPKNLNTVGGLKRTANLANPDGWVALLGAVGLQPEAIRDGVVGSICPNAAAHSARGNTGFAYLGDGAFECFHGHCAHLKSPDFQRMLKDRYEDYADVGLLDAGLPNTSGAFIAQHEFKRLGADVAAQEDLRSASVLGAKIIEEHALDAGDKERGFDALVERFVYVVQQKLWLDTYTRRTYSDESFERLHIVLKVIPVGKSGEKRAVSKMLNDERVIKCETFDYVVGNHDAVVERGFDRDGRPISYANSFSGPNIKRVAGLPTWWLRHVRWLIADADTQEYFLDWAAWVFQNLNDRTHIIPLIQGEPGVGKDTLFKPLICLLGPENETKLTQELLNSNFTGYLEHKFLYMSEMEISDRKTMDKLKRLTSKDASLVTVEHKFEKPYKIKPRHIVFGTTNHADSIRGMDVKDRRFMPYSSPVKAVVDGPASKDVNVDGSDAYFAALHRALDSADEMGRVLDFLMSRNVSGFNAFGSPPDFSGSKLNMQQAALSSAARFAHDCLVGAHGRFSLRKAFTMQELLEAAQSSGDPLVRNFATPSALRPGVALSGAFSLGQFRAGAGGRNATRLRVWAAPAYKNDEKLIEQIKKDLENDAEKYIENDRNNSAKHFMGFSGEVKNTPENEFKFII